MRGDRAAATRPEVDRCRPRSRAAFSHSFASDAAELSRLRRCLRPWLLEVGVDEEAAADVVLATSEACTNAMEHGHGFAAAEEVDVEAAVEGEELEVVVADHGHWRAPTSGDDRRGRGLLLMRALMGEVHVDAGPGGTTVRMRRRLPSSRA